MAQLSDNACITGRLFVFIVYLFVMLVNLMIESIKDYYCEILCSDVYTWLFINIAYMYRGLSVCLKEKRFKINITLNKITDLQGCEINPGQSSGQLSHGLPSETSFIRTPWEQRNF